MPLYLSRSLQLRQGVLERAVHFEPIDIVGLARPTRRGSVVVARAVVGRNPVATAVNIGARRRVLLALDGAQHALVGTLGSPGGLQVALGGDGDSPVAIGARHSTTAVFRMVCTNLGNDGRQWSRRQHRTPRTISDCSQRRSTRTRPRLGLRLSDCRRRAAPAIVHLRDGALMLVAASCSNRPAAVADGTRRPPKGPRPDDDEFSYEREPRLVAACALRCTRPGMGAPLFLDRRRCRTTATCVSHDATPTGQNQSGIRRPRRSCRHQAQIVLAGVRQRAPDTSCARGQRQSSRRIFMG